MQSYILQALLIRKDHIEYMKTRAIVQAIVNEGAADKALKEYSEAQQPYLVGLRGRDRAEHIARLMKEVAAGPMGVTPVTTKRVKSKLRTRIYEREERTKK